MSDTLSTTTDESLLRQAADIIRKAREMNLTVRILACSHYLRETVAMSNAGAHKVFSGEGEVALAMTEYILSQLGATPEQMDLQFKEKSILEVECGNFF